MIVLILILVMIIINGITIKGKNDFFRDYCSQENTTTINSIFSILIFLSHSVQYFDANSIFDEPYLEFRKFLGQLVVVTYLFFSGFGIMESIKKRGSNYINLFPKNRILKLWYHFSLMLILFIIVSLFIDKHYPISRYLLAFTGINSIGNSNWYVLVILLFYILIYISFKIFKKSNVYAVLFVSIISIFSVVIAVNCGSPQRFYNTALCLPLGMIFSLIKPNLDKFLMKNDIIYTTFLGIVILIFLYFSQNRSNSITHIIFFYLIGSILIPMFMMKINLKSTILNWFSEHTFSFFILQRIPMILLKHFNLNNSGVFFVILSFFATVILVTLFDEFINKTDEYIFKRKKQPSL